jgi:integrase
MRTNAWFSYQEQRLREQAAPKSVNEEVGFLPRLLGEGGQLIRARLSRQKALKLKGSKPVAKAYSAEEKQKLVEASREARSPAIYLALMLALNAGMRNGEIRHLRWNQVDLKKEFLSVGRSKTEAGEGRTIPLNAALLEALRHHADWYVLRFGRIEPDWYLFPLKTYSPRISPPSVNGPASTSFPSEASLRSQSRWSWDTRFNSGVRSAVHFGPFITKAA